MKKRLLVHYLHGPCDVLVTLRQRLVLPAHRTQHRPQRLAVESADRGCAVFPRVIDFLPMVAEIIQIKTKHPVSAKLHYTAHLTEKPRLAIWRQSHDLVFVAVVQETEVLRQCLIENAQRVREIHPPADFNLGAATHAPGGAGEIPEPIHRHRSRFLERRNQERRGQVRDMMLNVVQFSTESLAGMQSVQQVPNALPAPPVHHPVQDEPRIRQVPERIPRLFPQVRARIVVYGHMLHVFETCAGRFEAVTDRLGRKPGPVLNAAKPFFLDRSNQLAILQQTG